MIFPVPTVNLLESSQSENSLDSPTLILKSLSSDSPRSYKNLLSNSAPTPFNPPPSPINNDIPDCAKNGNVLPAAISAFNPESETFV